MTLIQDFGGVRVRAPGKINVFLAVGGRHDDGYHELATAFQAVSLYEDVVATASDELTISVTGDVDIAGVPEDESNLALRAARLLAEETGTRLGAHLDVRKAVPVAGGMGGGSADAAAALVACDALWGTGLAARELQELGARLGADVPFALMGGTAIGTGRGDRLNPALARGRFDWVLVESPFGLSTPDVYRELDRLREEEGAGASAPAVEATVLQALRAGDPEALAETLRNDLQEAALSLRPDLRALLDRGIARGAVAGLVSGSGPTVAFLAADAEQAKRLSRALRDEGLRAMRVHGPVHGARVV
ncbi:4-(cytidine 5'-diphospho)-2-C-methyl-D-erythritol kinase [Microbacterium sp. gxy059]|uniref:4-(cytidine 5'-diphospho)-2-C-methyl-D-erythritol kinase n=1 Tax=Microbacterium sp. gxy059 TaxID=2957199 RepID=UPI003D99683E